MPCRKRIVLISVKCCSVVNDRFPCHMWYIPIAWSFAVPRQHWRVNLVRKLSKCAVILINVTPNIQRCKTASSFEAFSSCFYSPVVNSVSKDTCVYSHDPICLTRDQWIIQRKLVRVHHPIRYGEILRMHIVITISAVDAQDFSTNSFSLNYIKQHNVSPLPDQGASKW